MTRSRLVAWCLMTYLALLVAAKTLKYVTTDASIFDTLFRAKYEAHISIIVAHGASAIVALVTGPTQFLSALRRKWPRLHRVLGRVCILSMFVAAPTGFFMGTMAHGGIVAQVAFCLMATLWLVAAVRAFDTARRRRLAEHRAWAIRAYALTFGAVTLRVYLNLLQTAGFDFEAIYPWTAWAAWVPNLVVAEWLAGKLDAAIARGTAHASAGANRAGENAVHASFSSPS